MTSARVAVGADCPTLGPLGHCFALVPLGHCPALGPLGHWLPWAPWATGCPGPPGPLPVRGAQAGHKGPGARFVREPIGYTTLNLILIRKTPSHPHLRLLRSQSLTPLHHLPKKALEGQAPVQLPHFGQHCLKPLLFRLLRLELPH